MTATSPATDAELAPLRETFAGLCGQFSVDVPQHVSDNFFKALRIRFRSYSRLDEQARLALMKEEIKSLLVGVQVADLLLGVVSQQMPHRPAQHGAPVSFHSSH